MASPKSPTRPTQQNPEPSFHDFLPAMAGKLGGEGLIGELCNGFELLMDREKGVITFESLRRNAAVVLGLGDLTDEDVRSMIKEGDFDCDGALNQMEFCVLMFRLSPDLMDASRCLVTEAIEEEYGRAFAFCDDLMRRCIQWSLTSVVECNRYYSMYGHVEKLAQEIRKGAASVDGVDAKLWQVPETLPEDVLSKMSAPPKRDAPLITPNDLAEADGFVFGFPTRFGMMAAQFKAFLDSTGGLWRTQQLAGKPAGIFYSTGSQGGGQETTALTAITQLVHHGMIFVPIGYTFGAGMFEMEKVKGGSPYGAGTFAGDGSRQPTELELEQAFHQGKYIAAISKKLKGPAAA
ncbi:hypothetical protein Bca4012_088312 [Brassica carinata]